MLKQTSADSTTIDSEAPASDATPTKRKRGKIVVRLDTKTGIATLPPRPDPYFQKVRRHFALGLRKTGHSSIWVARWDGGAKRALHTLGELTPAFGHVEALQAAEAWLANLLGGVSTRTDDGTVKTVAWACKLYVATLRAERPKAADDAQARFLRALLGGKTTHGEYKRHTFADLELSKLKAYHFRQWRNLLTASPDDKELPGLGMSKANANRVFVPVKAALIAAAADGLAPDCVAVACSKVQKFEDASARRSVYLDRKQRRIVLDACEGLLGDLVEGAALTGARGGELKNMRREDFDERQGTASFTGKTGTRVVALSPAAVTFFKRIASGKLPKAWMFTQDNGKPWTASQWGIKLRRVVERIIVEGIHKSAPDVIPANVVLYTFRHCWITDAIMHGKMSPLDAARATGTSIVQIEKHYGQLVQDVLRERLASFAML